MLFASFHFSAVSLLAAAAVVASPAATGSRATAFSAHAAREIFQYNFTGSPDGADPVGTPVVDASGSVYGVTYQGGRFGLGSVYQLRRTSLGIRESIIYSFGSSGPIDGIYPFDGLIVDAKGTLYGTTQLGGSSALCDLTLPNQPPGCGTVFKLTPTEHGYVETIIHRFTSGTDGRYPFTALAMDRFGALYGATALSQASNGFSNGTIYKLSPTTTGYTFNLLYTFPYNSVQGPQNALLVDQRTGIVYGTSPGYFGLLSEPFGGLVFALTPTSKSYRPSVVHTFSGVDGDQPFQGVTMDRAGALYGTTSVGGRYGKGTVYKLTPSSTGYTLNTLHDFAGGSDGSGSNPSYGRLTLDAHESLYGTTPSGGPGPGFGANPGNGTVFSLTPTKAGYRETVLHTFNVPGGSTRTFSAGGVALFPGGYLIGTTFGDDVHFYGTLFVLQ